MLIRGFQAKKKTFNWMEEIEDDEIENEIEYAEENVNEDKEEDDEEDDDEEDNEENYVEEQKVKENVEKNDKEVNDTYKDKNEDNEKNDVISENDVIIDSPIPVNPNQKDKKEESLKIRKLKKNSATWEIVTQEEIKLEQWQYSTNSENDENYQPTDEEIFEQEPEFFDNDEISQRFMHLVQNVREIFKIERKDWEQNPYFKILWWKTADFILEYLFYLIEENDEPVDLYIKKIETNQEDEYENEHLVQFSYNVNKELNIFVDEIILYEKVNKSDSDTPEYNDTKSILEKFIFLTDNHYDKLKAEINKQQEEKQKKKQLQQIFKGF